MIGIEAIATYLPRESVNVLDQAGRYGVDEAFILGKTGMVSLARKDSDEETSDLCVNAYRSLQRSVGFNDDEIGCLIVCTQNPDGSGLPHTSAIVHGKLGLKSSCASFDISLGCSGYVYGLNVAQAFMEANGITRGVLLTSDPYSKILNADDKNTSLLFGDGAAATLIGTSPVWVLGKCIFGTDGSGASGIMVDPSSRMLSMNGRAVYTFSATVVPGAIREVAALNQIPLDNVDLFALHQGSRYIVETIRDRLGQPESKVPFSAARYGNLVSSSIPFVLADHIHQNVSRIVIAGFGVGLSWAAGILSRP